MVDFLRSHPDFFTEHTDLLNRLSVPHQAGAGIASLIEKQVQIMRRRIEDLEQKLEKTKHQESFIFTWLKMPDVWLLIYSTRRIRKHSIKNWSTDYRTIIKRTNFACMFLPGVQRQMIAVGFVLEKQMTG